MKWGVFTGLSHCISGQQPMSSEGFNRGGSTGSLCTTRHPTSGQAAVRCLTVGQNVLTQQMERRETIMQCICASFGCILANMIDTYDQRESGQRHPTTPAV